jgi:ADP-ribose pyrophosphatase YjhB (NUDIX family)
MPTGLLDPGEDIVDAAVREAKEETGLDCIFDKILCMRQAHGGIFNQSDMFCVCACTLSPKYNDLLDSNQEITLIPQEEEIADIAWMDVHDFSKQELWQQSPLYKDLNDTIHLAVKSLDDSDTNKNDERKTQFGFIAKTLPLGYRSGEQTIYRSSL